MRRRGFTLVEILVAVVVASLVVTMAYGTSQAGFDTEARLEAHRTGMEREAALRVLVADALRHALQGARGGDPVFDLADRLAADGSPADSLRFATRGVTPPLGASATWDVSLWVEDGALRLAATPREGEERSPAVTARLDGVRGLDLRVLGRGPGAAWQHTWPERDLAPDALSYVVVGARGGGTPVVLRRGLERAP